MKKTAALLLLSAVFSLPAAAEPLNYRLLRFSETVSRDVPNDWMTVRLRIQTRHADAAQAAAGTTRKLNILQNRLRALSGIESELEFRSAYSSPTGHNDRTQRIWQDEAVLRVSGSDFQTLGKLLAQSSSEAAIDYLAFSLKPATRHQVTEALSSEALQRFRQRAQTLSRAMGGSTYQVVEVALQQDMQADHMQKSAPGVRAYANSMEAMPEPVFDTPGLTTVSQTANGTVQYQ